MRFLLFLLLAPSVAVGVAAGVSDRNPVAMGMALGFAAPLVLAAALLVKPRPARKADPAKVARLEINLQTGPAWEEYKRREQSEALTDVMADPGMRHGVLTGCTTMLLTDEHGQCPRPEGCVAAHPCRACGADKGQPCATTATIWQAPLASEARKARGIQ